MDASNINLGELIEKGQNVTANAVKTTVSDTANSVSAQIGLKTEANAKTQSQSQPQDQTQQQGELAQVQTERTKEMVRDFYSPSDDLTQSNPQTPVTEEQQLASVRQKLHQEQHEETYYEPLFSYEHNLNKTESKTEELEREKKQEMQELQQSQADKPPPLAVQRGQAHVEAPLSAG